MRRLWFAAAAAMLAAAGGCGDGLKRVSVQGKLTAGGQPLAGATVQFIPSNAVAGEGGIGRTDADGAFTLTGSRNGAKGVVPGQYKVRVSRLVARDGTALPPDAKQADNPGCRESVPAKYTSVDGSPLNATVPEAGGALTIEIPEPLAGKK
ncbi:carboxypeptidase-like regulatory domain-containing protein [Fimbriiglobus ruber]|uniref:Carboxypeptidase regulatory-like domain-containing protein n=1 Tax=Fimbriiglobus ruber TaxID=1908690 RepID=A0A225E2Y1_9BACT|nr:carboxypeptidase-like regulatory domain-containing protein [Fimbriiglobus ruber]OWK45148.1 hypothetical protein FRUB_01479 [Fimbriiglobus ruber]